MVDTSWLVFLFVTGLAGTSSSSDAWSALLCADLGKHNVIPDPNILRVDVGHLDVDLPSLVKIYNRHDGR